MARKLKTYNFRTRGNSIQYPWDKWTDGSIWQVKKGEDFTCSLGSFIAGASSVAHRRSMRVRMNQDKVNETITFQFYERQAEAAD